MPRSRLAWRWFVAWSLLVVGLLVVCQWIASVELARLADAMQMERMSERARNLSASLPDDPDGDRAWLEPFGRGTEGSAVEVFDVLGRPIAGGESTDPDADGKGLDAATLADALAGRLRFGDATVSTAGVSVQGRILARSGDAVLCLPVSAADVALLRGLQAGLALGASIAQAPEGADGQALDVSQTLALLIQHQLITDVTHPPTDHTPLGD
jgi:hypothetical protein